MPISAPSDMMMPPARADARPTAMVPEKKIPPRMIVVMKRHTAVLAVLPTSKTMNMISGFVLVNASMPTQFPTITARTVAGIEITAAETLRLTQ